MSKLSYIEFVLDESASAGRKTQVWQVLATRDGFQLGTILWFGHWRQYVFCPGMSTVYSAGCLDEINAKIRELMAARRA